MPGFFLTYSIQLSQVSALVNLTDPSLRFAMVDAFKCLEKETKTTKTLYKENLFTLCRLYFRIRPGVIQVKMQNLIEVDFIEVVINLYCRPTSQPVLP